MSIRSNHSTGVVLASASAGGTIATVRCLGAHGYDVAVLFSTYRSAAYWSKYVKSAHLTPKETDPARFIDKLMKIGEARPGQILLPTSDETAWLYSEHADRLSRYFTVYQPPIETLRRVLDKAGLNAAAERASISVPATWDPATVADLPRLAATLPYPILIKPRTHVHRLGNDKGVIVRSPDELLREYGAFLGRESDRAAQNDLLTEASTPLLQEFIDSGTGAVSISGFIDRSGELFVSRRTQKVFQRMHATGVGVCFEAMPPDPDLSEAVRRLCRELGYFGIFEVEFLRSRGRWALIDFNPRLFNQAGLDIYRGAPLPLLACLDAMNETQALRDAVERARAYDETQPASICDGFTLNAILYAQMVRGSLSQSEREYWANWIKQRSDHTIGFFMDRLDRLPGYVHAISELYLGIRAIPRFLRLTARAPSAAPQIAKR